MPLPFDLEDWLTEMGDIVLRKKIQGEPLTPREDLLYEIWLLDTETRNGGLSQYFANRGLRQWSLLKSVVSPIRIPSFPSFAAAIDSLIVGHEDPYIFLVDNESLASDLYDQYQLPMVSELRTTFDSAP